MPTIKNPTIDKKLVVYCFSPASYWKTIKNNFVSLPWKVKYRPKNTKLFYQKIKGLEKLEKRVWTIANPSFIRTNFGLFGPGIILAAEFDKKIIGAIYFTAPSTFCQEILIWTLIIDHNYRQIKVASKLLTSILYAFQNYAKKIVIQARTDSDALGLYLKLGSNRIVWCQSIDTKNWKKPKIGIEIDYPKNPNIVLNPSVNKICKKNKIIKVRDNANFWKKIGKTQKLWGKYEIVNIESDKKGKILFLKK
jgi:hypothetical protein